MTKKYSEPDRSNPNNYMFDTSAYNHIIESDEKMNAAKKSNSYGFVIIQQHYRITNF